MGNFKLWEEIMVTREYHCNCGYKIEEQVSIHEDIRKKCPKCNGKLIQRYGKNEALLFNFGGGARTQQFK